jgi:hypothetical protein
MINASNYNAQRSGTVIVDMQQAKILNWTKSSSQPMTALPRAGKLLYANRAVKVRDGEMYVIARGGSEVKVREIGENKYEVIV